MDHESTMPSPGTRSLFASCEPLVQKKTATGAQSQVTATEPQEFKATRCAVVLEFE